MPRFTSAANPKKPRQPAGWARKPFKTTHSRRANGWANLTNNRDTLAGDRDTRTNDAATFADDRDLRADDRDTFANDAANFANDRATRADDAANFANGRDAAADDGATRAIGRSIPANDGGNLALDGAKCADGSATVAVSGVSCGQAGVRCVNRYKYGIQITCGWRVTGIKTVFTYATQIPKHHRNGSHRGCLYEPERHDLERHESGR